MSRLSRREGTIATSLIVGGIFLILYVFIYSRFYLYVLVLFCCWFINACVKVYRIYEPNFIDPLARNYCNYVLFTFAFWLLNSVYIFATISLLILCCIYSFYLICDPIINSTLYYSTGSICDTTGYRFSNGRNYGHRVNSSWEFSFF